MKLMSSISRRGLIRGGAALIAAPAILRASRAMGQSATFKIGYVSPQTGPLAGFGESDAFALEAVKAAFAGLTNNGAPVAVEIIVKDTQSSPNRASEVTAELIESDGVNLVIAQGAPETTNPVADQCELSEMPCITTMCPWQPWFFGRNGDPAKGFDYTYHYFWGLEDVIANFLDMWDAAGLTSKNIAGLFPNDADGNAWGDPELGLPKPLLDRGYTVIDPGRYQVMNNDFSSQIAAFKEAGCEIVTGNMIPPDFATFWAQAKQQNFNPKVVTIGKALLFPSFLESLGAAADGLSTEVWWSASHPYHSSLTGQSCKELADAFTAATGKPWTQIVGYSHSIFEVAADVVKRAAALDDSEAILEAVRTTDMQTIVGPVKFGGEGPFKNVVRTPLVGGQWQVGADGKPNLVITSNKQAPDIPVGGEFKLIGA